MELRNIRSGVYRCDAEDIDLCVHISISGVQRDEGSEYTELVEIFCKECAVRHAVELLIN